MKDGLRFVDCDMHIMEPPDLFARYLDPRFRSSSHPGAEFELPLPCEIDGRAEDTRRLLRRVKPRGVRDPPAPRADPSGPRACYVGALTNRLEGPLELVTAFLVTMALVMKIGPAGGDLAPGAS
jgi:hypothetical protein